MPYVSTLDEFPLTQVSSAASLPVDEVSGPDQDYFSGGDHGFYPVELSYEKMFEWVWRVRKWRIVASAHVRIVADFANDSPPPDLFRTVTTEGDWSMDQVISPPAIAAWSSATAYYAAAWMMVTYGGDYWICVQTHTNQTPAEPSAYWQKIHGATTDAEAEELTLLVSRRMMRDGSAQETITAGVDVEEQFYAYPPPDPAPTLSTVDAVASLILILPDASYPRWKRNDALWLPGFILGLTFGGPGDPNELTLSSAFEEDPDPGGISTYGYETIEMHGENITLQYESISDDGAGNVTTRTLTDFSCEITPYEWYPYDPGDGGGAVWDSADGSELRDRTTIQAPS